LMTEAVVENASRFGPSCRRHRCRSRRNWTDISERERSSLEVTT
jgi:hypothetical protein